MIYGTFAHNGNDGFVHIFFFFSFFFFWFELEKYI